jgi:hypothetical protein
MGRFIALAIVLATFSHSVLGCGNSAQSASRSFGCSIESSSFCSDSHSDGKQAPSSNHGDSSEISHNCQNTHCAALLPAQVEAKVLPNHMSYPALLSQTVPESPHLDPIPKPPKF